MIKDTALLIQGPLHFNSLIMLDQYSKYFDEIVYSTYQLTEKEKHLYNNILDKNQNINFVYNNIDDIPQTVSNQKNIAYQCLSTVNGVKNSQKKYILKIRSDEYFVNLQNFSESIEDVSKIYCSNIFFRDPNIYQYHASDHIIFAKKETMLDAFETLLFYLISKKNIKIPFIRINNPNFNLKIGLSLFVPEQLISLFFLNALEKNLSIKIDDIAQNVNFFQNYFRIINIKTLGPYLVSYMQDDKRYYVSNILHSSHFLVTDCDHISEYTL